MTNTKAEIGSAQWVLDAYGSAQKALAAYGIKCYQTRNVQAWAKKHGTERIVEEMSLLAATRPEIVPILRRVRESDGESSIFWTIRHGRSSSGRFPCVQILADDENEGIGALLNVVDFEQTLTAPDAALPQRFFMSIDMLCSVTNLTLMLPEDY